MVSKLKLLFHTTPDPMLAVARISLGSLATVQGFQNIFMFVPGALLLIGLFARLGALGVGASAIAAAIAGDHPEYWVATLVLAALVLLRGSGAWSIDRLLLHRVQDRLRSLRPSPLHDRTIYVSWTWFRLPHLRRW